MDNAPSLRRPAAPTRASASPRSLLAWDRAEGSATSVAAQIEPPRPPVPAERFNVLGVGLSVLDLPGATEAIIQGRGRLRRGYVCVTGVSGITEAQNRQDFRQILNGAWLNLPDGPLAQIGRAQGRSGAKRITGSDFMLEVLDAGRARGLTHYFYGGGPGVAETLRDRMLARFPGLEVAGIFAPPFRPLDAAEAGLLREDLARARPDVIWVGLSTPKQERFMAEFAPELEAGLLIGVGAAFDFHAGLRRAAPRWIRRNRLEWLFRLAGEPRRLGLRHWRNHLLFVARLFLQATRLRAYPLE